MGQAGCFTGINSFSSHGDVEGGPIVIIPISQVKKQAQRGSVAQDHTGAGAELGFAQ